MFQPAGNQDPNTAAPKARKPINDVDNTTEYYLFVTGSHHASRTPYSRLALALQGAKSAVSTEVNYWKARSGYDEKYLRWMETPEDNLDDGQMYDSVLVHRRTIYELPKILSRIVVWKGMPPGTIYGF